MTVGRVRRNPRDRASLRRAVPEAETREERPARRLPDGASLVAVLLRAESGAAAPLDRQAIAAGRSLADALGHGVLALVPDATELPDLAALGVDRIAEMGKLAPDAKCARLAAMWDTMPISHLLAMEGGAPAEALRRFAALSGQPVLANVRQWAGDGCICLEDSGATERRRERAPVLLLAPDQFRPDPETPKGEATPLTLPPANDPEAPEILETIRIPSSARPLAEADLILAGGAGVADWDLFHRLSGALGAAEAGSRVVCDAGHLPRDRQVGASGTAVAPRCYIALGISGAIQHLQGIEECPSVIAVNSDPHAPIHGRAQLSVTADAAEVMRALLREIGDRA